MRESLAPVAQDVLGERLEGRDLIPAKNRSARSVGDKGREIPKLKRAAIENRDVIGAPKQITGGAELVGEKMFRAREPAAETKEKIIEPPSLPCKSARE